MCREQKSVLKKRLRPSDAGGPLAALQEASEKTPAPSDCWTMIFYQQKRDRDASQWHVQLECVFPPNDSQHEAVKQVSNRCLKGRLPMSPWVRESFHPVSFHSAQMRKRSTSRALAYGSSQPAARAPVAPLRPRPLTCPPPGWRPPALPGCATCPPPGSARRGCKPSLLAARSPAGGGGRPPCRLVPGRARLGPKAGRQKRVQARRRHRPGTGGWSRGGRLQQRPFQPLEE